MIKMMYALIAIVLMFLANFLIIYARSRPKGWLRISISIIAFMMLIPIVILMLGVLF